MDNRTLQELEALKAKWLEAWPKALEAWSKFTRLRLPTLCLTTGQAKEEGLTSSFAMIRLEDQAVVVNMPEAVAFHLQDYAVEVLAHEIGHHVLAPATLTDHARMIARMRRSLPTAEHEASMVSNLYTDLLINDRLQRSAGLRMADIYKKIAGDTPGGAVWRLYVRIYEILWSLERGSLGSGPKEDRMDGDAWLGARIIRSYARNWIDGAGRFAALLLPHLLEDQQSRQILERLHDTRNAGAGGIPSGLVEEDPDEKNGAIHPSMDPDLTGEGGEAEEARPVDVGQNQPSGHQAREPFEYGEILRAAGVKLTDHDIAVRYYRERASQYLFPFPSVHAPESKEPLMEGVEPWDIGHPIDAADWMQSVMQAPRVIPGVTTVQRVFGTTEGKLAERIPLDLDLYVDCSGSMPNPQHQTSYPALAGAILCLSGLRAGARIHATLWSGKHQVTQTKGFVRDEQEILRVLTGYYGDGTAFPIPVLRATYESWPPGARPAHLLMISDDGITTMFEKDEKGNSGWDVSATALSRAGGGGTFVLNLFGDNAIIQRAQKDQGWQLYRITKWEELVDFAREFSRRKFNHRGTDSERARSKM